MQRGSRRPSFTVSLHVAQNMLRRSAVKAQHLVVQGAQAAESAWAERILSNSLAGCSTSASTISSFTRGYSRLVAGQACQNGWMQLLLRLPRQQVCGQAACPSLRSVVGTAADHADPVACRPVAAGTPWASSGASPQKRPKPKVTGAQGLQVACQWVGLLHACIETLAWYLHMVGVSNHT